MNDDFKYAILVAHPDDEVLFSSSLIKNASKIIIGFGEIPEKNMKIQSLGRKNIQNKYPFEKIIFLNIKQASKDPRKKISFDNASENKYGLIIKNNKKEYKENFFKLCNLLPIHLKGIDRVYTHSPWGDYGHEDHIQIFKCIMHLKKFNNFKVFVFAYISRDTVNLAYSNFKFLNGNFEVKRNDFKIYNLLKNLYIQEKCWTWSKKSKPALYEYFYEIDLNKNQNLKNINFTMNYFYQPFYSNKITPLNFKVNSKFFKLFMLQNKFFFKIRVFILKIFKIYY